MLGIRLLGTFEVALGEAFPPIQIKGQNAKGAKRLLALLVLNYEREVTRGWLAETIWPPDPKKERETDVRNYLNHALSELKKVLGSEWDRIKKPSDCIQLDLTGASVDLHEFDAAIELDNSSALEKAIELYRGPLLDSWTDDWIMPYRAMAEAKYLKALMSLASRAFANRPADAVPYLQKVLETDPYDNEAVNLLMKALASSSHFVEMAKIFQDYERRLRKDFNGGVELSPITKDLYQRLKLQAREPLFEPREMDPRRTNLLILTHLIGRKNEVEGVREKFKEGSRLVTLTGNGGVGKTRLAKAVANGWEKEHHGGIWFADGVWFISLEEVPASLELEGTELQDIVETIAKTVATVFAIREQEDMKETLARSIASRSMMLILDNCEHVVNACVSLVVHLLAVCPNLRILATSRHAFGIEEALYPVPPLSAPLPGETYTPESLDQYEAVCLFRYRAQAVRPEFTVTRENAAAIASICYHLDGIPLALELAAARVNVLSVEQINTRLHNLFQLQIGGSTTTPPRHKTLSALMDWSYDLLGEKSQELLKRLSIFAGGCSLEAAEKVCAGNGIEEWEVLVLLASLVENSLVVVEAKEKEVRYRLLETIRHYADEKLQESGEADLVRQRHQRFYLSLAEQAEPHLTTNERGNWFRRLEEEHDNLRAAVEFSLSEPSTADLRFCGHLYRFWWKRGHLSEGRQWCRQALKKASGHSRSLEQAKVLLGSGFLASDQGDFVSARDYYGESLSIAREIGGNEQIRSVLNQLGGVACDQGDYVAARAYHYDSLFISREIEDEKGVATSLSNLGLVAQYQGDFVTARANHEESLSLMEKIKDMEGIAATLYNLGAVAVEQGDYISAQNHYERISFFRQEYVAPSTLAGMFLNRGHIANIQTDYVTAKNYYYQSLSISNEIEDKQGIALALNALGIVSQHQGDLEASQTYHTDSLSIRREIGVKRGIAESLCNLGYVAQDQADYTSAQTRYSESLSLYQVIGDPWGIAALHCNLGIIAKYQADYASAWVHYHESLSRFRAMENSRCIASTLEAIASLAAVLKQTERAARLWGAAAALRIKIGAPLAPNEQEEYDLDVAAARAIADEKALSAVWLEGSSMPLEQVIEYALEGPLS